MTGIYNAKYLDVILLKRGEQSLRYSHHVREFLVEFGVIQQEINYNHNKTQGLIAERLLEGGDPKCLKSSEAVLNKITEDIGHQLQKIMQEVNNALSDFYDSNFYKYLAEVEAVTLEMTTELLINFGRYNSVIKVNKLSSSAIHQSYMLMNHYDKSKERLLNEIDVFEQKLIEFYATIFQKIYIEENNYVGKVLDIQKLIEEC
jgi:hypothetical protein